MPRSEVLSPRQDDRLNRHQHLISASAKVPTRSGHGAIIMLCLAAFWDLSKSSMQMLNATGTTVLQVWWATRKSLLQTWWAMRSMGLHAFWALRKCAFRIFWRSRRIANILTTPSEIRALLRHFIIVPVGRVALALLWPFRARRFSLAAMSEFLREKDCPVICFDAPERLAIPAPRFLGSQPGGGESFTLETAGFVEIKPLKLEIAEIADAVVIGGTNFMLANGCAVHPDLYLAEREVCPAETFGVATVRPDEQQITIYMRRGTRNVERAISLLGQCTGNYAHWLTETLPKLLIADMFPQYDGLPLLIDGWIHPVFYETVDVLGKQKREIIRIGRWRAVKLGSVVSVSPTAYIPAEYREFVTTGKLIKLRSDEFKFSQRALELLRDKAHEVIAPRAGAPSRWLYLHRDSCGNGRRVIGAEQIEELARHFGFDIIEPGTMKFVDQVQAFRNAEIIMAPLGAALTNAIFSPPGCKVIAIAPYFAGANYDYYAQFMGLLGHDLYYVLGPQTHHGIHPLHRDYHADIVALRLVLQKICSQFSKCPAQPAAALHSS